MVAVEPLKEMRQVLTDTLPNTQALDGEHNAILPHKTLRTLCYI
jgi:hypothetical protein